MKPVVLLVVSAAGEVAANDVDPVMTETSENGDDLVHPVHPPLVIDAVFHPVPHRLDIDAADSKTA